MPQLDSTWFASQLFWLAVTFALLYFVLSRLVLPPLQSIITRRQQMVEQDLSEAQGLKTQADQAKSDYERALAEARSRAQQLMANATAENKTKAEQKNKAIDGEIASILSQASSKINVKKNEMIAALTPAASELTTMIVEKLTHQSPGHDKVAMALNLSKGAKLMATDASLLNDPHFWVAVAFFVFIALSYKKVATMTVRILDDRSVKITAELNEAKRLREEAEMLLVQYKQKQADYLKEAESILADAVKDAESLRNFSEQELKTSMDVRLKLATDRIAQEESKAIADVRNHVVDIALAAARALIIDHVGSMSQEDLVKFAVADIERKIH